MTVKSSYINPSRALGSPIKVQITYSHGILYPTARDILQSQTLT